ncbi:BPSS1780 family membrane protein [Bordetella genomosp. 13]|uniref:BPSS1780 family membrane protein n=1 Tax=Bordetella genomosp. 13 TaxID=463040 RepID=UPI001E5FE406|nr:BPSS1780 family membrane protein [Bordetella genomosp. 13]
MQAASLPASAGWQWIRTGLQLFLKQPLAMFTWSMVVGLFVLFAALTLPIGPLLLPVLMPIVALMSLSASKHIEAGRTMLPSMWPKPLQRPGVFKKLSMMGMLYAAAVLAAEIVAVLPFAGNIAEGVNLATASKDIGPMLAAMREPLILFALLYLPIAALFWHAPVLVAWHGLRMTQALFFSGVACWRNKWAFLVYGVAWALIFMFIDLATGLLVAAGLPAPLMNALQMPVNIAAGGVLYSSFYPAYTTIFGSDDASTGLDDRDGATA